MKQKNKVRYIVTAILTVSLSLFLFGCDGTKEPVRSADIAILYTGDVHCAVDKSIGYAGLAAFKSELETQGAQVLLVDSSDAIQGAPIGSLSKGSLPNGSKAISALIDDNIHDSIVRYFKVPAYSNKVFRSDFRFMLNPSLRNFQSFLLLGVQNKFRGMRNDETGSSSA